MKLFHLFIGLSLLSLVTACSSATSSSSGTLTILGSDSATDTSNDLVSATLGGSPSALELSVYGLWISANEDCSDPVEVENDVSATTYDLVSGPTLFSGSPTAGTYPCIIIKMDDILTFTVDSEAVSLNPACESTTTEHQHDIYRADSDDTPWLDIEGNDITGTGSGTSPSRDTVYTFASTNPSAIPSTTAVPNQIIELDNPLIVPGQMTFVFDMQDGIDTQTDESNNEYCVVEEGSMSFR